MFCKHYEDSKHKHPFTCNSGKPAKPRRRTIAFAVRLLAAATMAGGSASVMAQADTQDLEKVVIQGNVEAEALTGSTVVEIISADKLVETGADDLNSALDKLIPSFRWPQTANSGNSSGDVKSVSLRGISPSYTLVLVNGRRRHVSAQLSNRAGFSSAQRVDINQIPINAIERIEVLRDGTSTRYGGDAVAGAINIVLKSNASGGQVSSRFGQTSRGDGTSRWVGGTAGSTLGSDGFLTLSVDYLNKERIDRAGPNYNQILDGKPWNLKRDEWGDSQIKSGHFVLNGEVPITDALRAYAVGSYGSSRSRSVSRPVRYWAASNDIERFPDGHQPRFRSETEDYDLSAGLRWNDERIGRFDFSLGRGHNRLKEYTDETASVSWGPESQTRFYRGSYTHEEDSANLDWEKGFDLGLARPLELSAGVAWREERWKSGLGDLQSYSQGPITTTIDPRDGVTSRPTPNGNPELWGILPEDLASLSRHVASVYFGTDAQLAKGFNLSGVLRYEDYSDVGSVTTAQLAARYDFTPAVALRGAVGTGFKAPSIAHVGSTAGELDTVTGNGDRRLRPDDPRARALGATELKPSQSDNVGLGLVLRPTENTALTIDAWQVKIRDQIVSSASLSGPEVSALLAASGDNTTTSVTFYTNGVDTTTRGVDVAAKWQPALPTGYGNLKLTLGYSYARSKVDKLSQSSVLARTLINEGVVRNIEETQPKNKLVIGADYDYRNWHLSATVLRYGESTFYRNPSANLPEPINVLTYSPAWILNLRFGYDITDQLSVALGANNVFDRMPEKTPFPNSGIDQYGHTPAYGSAGAQYFASLDFKF
jgi:iron complex outermembrane receptor protein